ncbi:MAG TPA: hypothetical protein VKU19_01670 [Bryobacteraceae bacterium]|nr:hypothetical protein [Bryobacteraceae bacterium]
MDVEKTMQFILEQNALNTVQIAQLRETVLAHDRDIEAHERDLQVHTEWKLAMSQALQDLASQMKAGFDKVAEKHAELTQKQAEMTESLHILIRTVQDMIPRLPNQ